MVAISIFIGYTDTYTYIYVHTHTHTIECYHLWDWESAPQIKLGLAIRKNRLLPGNLFG